MFKYRLNLIFKLYIIPLISTTFFIAGYLIHSKVYSAIIEDTHLQDTQSSKRKPNTTIVLEVGSTSTANYDYAVSKFISKMRRRVEKIDDTCKNKRQDFRNHIFLESFRNFRTHIYWLPNDNIAYCPVFKSATSTWLSHVIEMANVTKETSNSAKDKYPALVKQLLHLGAVNPRSNAWKKFVTHLPQPSDFIGLIVVRHPFDRLVSAFRDKLERNNLIEPFYYEQFGKAFVKRYRKMAIEALGEQYFNKENHFGTPVLVKDNRRPNSNLPSFWEFAQSVIDGFKIDEHWAPINKYCSICSYPATRAFKYVLKFEELEHEEKLFLIHSGWERKIKRKEKINVNDHNGLSGKDITQIYFSILSKKQILSLYGVYEFDFHLFEYSFILGDIHLPLPL